MREDVMLALAPRTATPDEARTAAESEMMRRLGNAHITPWGRALVESAGARAYRDALGVPWWARPITNRAAAPAGQGGGDGR